MADSTPDEGAQRTSDLAFLAAAREQLAAPEGVDLDLLQTQLQALVASPDPLVADAAAIVELRVLGALLKHQAAEMRTLATRLIHTARWLPPAQVGLN